MNTRIGLTLLGLLTLLSACDKTDRSFSILSENDSFKQSATYIPRKLDVLWIIDNSGSMQTSQNELTSNFTSFISRFKQKQYDFNMAVNGTDAWQGLFDLKPTQVDNMLFRDGADCDRPNQTPPVSIHTHSQQFILNNQTVDIQNVFVQNATLSICGTGNERALQSIEATLADARNFGFRRAGAYLAIIIVGDEDDLSSILADKVIDGDYSDPNLIPVQHYVDYLDGLVGKGNYSVSTIAIDTPECKTEKDLDGFNRSIGTRMFELATLTGGVKASLCSDSGTSLNLISDTIAKVTSQFLLEREPLIATIKAVVNNVVIPNDPTNGWTYNPETKILTFNGSSMPNEGDQVAITYDPVSGKN